MKCRHSIPGAALAILLLNFGSIEPAAGEGSVLAQSTTSASGNGGEITEGAGVTLTGKLKGGIIAIGGETTGWLLTYRAGTGKHKIEVDVSALKDVEIREGEVRVTGRIIKRNYTERGPTLILKATGIEAGQGDDA